ncbi:response regulator [Arenimonas terrae]|jgi:DNA-binding response OmpR family regulator|uniref:Response regulator n=1 Tax=Arenimonas terrae TaxID=2546226 RepID=A0A5C4RVA4_9GAMM|nr:response regulator [Arenimonas terrae]TNJ34938.1 response regulator [Arenimonas terrae]
MNPRLLLLEDDAVSAAFLCEALAGLPAQVDHAPDLDSARRLAGPEHAAWLFDARLPDGHASDLLVELRARGLQAPALALTAEHDPRALRRLEACGFQQALAKPVSATALLAAVRRAVSMSVDAWDDEAARRALGGDDASVQALRALFLRELPGQLGLLRDACRRGDTAIAQEHLHRLKASCGFVGAGRLLAEVRALSAQPEDGATLDRLQARAAELLVR